MRLEGAGSTVVADSEWRRRPRRGNERRRFGKWPLRTQSGLGRNVQRCLRASYVVEMVVSAYRDGMLAWRESVGYGEVVALLDGVADISDWSNEHPIISVDAALGAFDAAGCVTCDEFDLSTCGCGRRISPADHGRFQVLDRGRRVVHHKALAFTL